MKQRTFWIASLAMVGLLVCAPLPASAQNDPRDRIIPQLALEDAPIRDALKIIFRFAQASYTVASDVQGEVTVDLVNKPFEDVLRNVLNQVDATWRVEGGIYNVIRKPQQGTVTTPDIPDLPTTATAKFPQKIQLRNADPALIVALLRNQYTVDATLIPETSTWNGVQSGGGGGFGGGGGGGGFGGGGGGFGGGGFGGGGGGFGGSGGGGFGGGSGGFGGGGGRGGGGSGFGGRWITPGL